MIALIIIFVLLALLLSLKVGAAASYTGGVFGLKIKAGPVKLTVLPKKEKAEAETVKKKKKAKAAEEAEPKKLPKEKKPGQKLTFEDIMGIVKLALEALGRFRRSLSIDLLELHLVTAGPDPYSAVMNYGYFNAAIGALLPALHRTFKIKKEDISSDIDFEADKMKIDAALALTIRIGQILLIALCAGFAFLKWMLRRRRRRKAEEKAAKAAEKNENNDIQPEKGQ